MHLSRTHMTSAFFAFTLLATPCAQSSHLDDLRPEEIERYMKFLEAQQNVYSSFSAPSAPVLPNSELPQGGDNIPSSAMPFGPSAPALPAAPSVPPRLAPHLEEYPPLHMSRVLSSTEQQELQRAIQTEDEEAIKRLLGASDLTPWERYAQTHPDFAKALKEPFFARMLAGVWQEHTNPTPLPSGQTRIVRSEEQVLEGAFAAFGILLNMKEFQDVFSGHIQEQTSATASLWAYMRDTIEGFLPNNQ